MPTYQYACTDNQCGNRFELVQSFTDPAATECPVCERPVRKVYGSVGVVFKGSGFYRTDNRASSAESLADSKSESKSESKSDAKSDAKSDSKSDSKSEPKPKNEAARSKPEFKSGTGGDSKPAAAASA
jgi:putative FmdB family regulatory protein